MLCYNCIVQLNLAYNFKNTAIETNLYLERFAIENGLNNASAINSAHVGILTPAESSLLGEDDQQEEDGASSVLSSSVAINFPARLLLPPPRPTSTISSTLENHSPNKSEETGAESEGDPQPSTSNANLSFSTSSSSTNMNWERSLLILDPEQIKKEPEDAFTSSFSNVDRTAVAEAIAERNLVTRLGRGDTESSPRKGRGRPSSGNGNSSTSPRKPMVAVPQLIRKSALQDQEYLKKILRRKTSVEQEKEAKKADRRYRKMKREEERKELKRSIANTGLGYDLNNSQFVREIYENLPKSRLRVRRKSMS